MDQVSLATREALWVSLQIGGPPLIAMLVVGLVISVLQALTQIQEASLAFLPKLGALAAVLVILGPFMTGALRGHMETLFAMMIAAGGAP